MRTRVEIADPVRDFVRALAPEPRRAVRLALHALEKEHGDIKPLEGELSGYYRLRVGSYRVIFRSGVERGTRVLRCVFAEHRSVVYELFIEEVRRMLAEE
jgi:mRNA interferase RelE/StbE